MSETLWMVLIAIGLLTIAVVPHLTYRAEIRRLKEELAITRELAEAFETEAAAHKRNAEAQAELAEANARLAKSYKKGFDLAYPD